MANLGFFAGGLSDSLNQGLQRNNQANYQQQELQIQQQGQQMAQQRFEMSQRVELMSKVSAHLTETISELRAVGEDPKVIQGKIQGLQDQLRALSTASGYPGYADAAVSAAMAAPPKTQVIAAEAQAKETPATRAEKESLAKYRAAQADPFGLGPSGSQVTGVDVQEIPPGVPASPRAAVAATSGQPSAAAPVQTAQAEPTPQINGSGQGQSGDSFLSTLPPQTAQAVKSVGDYEMDPSSLLSRGTLQSRTQFLGLVKEYNPNFDVKEYKARNTAYTAFLNPNSVTAKSLKSFNVLTDHLDTLGQAADALKNKDLVTFNALKNAIATQTGEPAPNTFEGVRDIVGDELVKAIIGGGGALGDREAVKSRINAASSPKQLSDLINNYKKLAGGQLTGLRKSYEEGTGRKDFDRFLLPAAKRQFEQGASVKSSDQGETGKHPSSMSDDEIRKKLGL